MILKNSILCAVLALVVVSCTKESDEPETVPTPTTPGLTIPSFYDSASYVSNSQLMVSVRTQMDALVTELKKGRTTANTLDATTLNSIYTTGDVTLQSIASSFYDAQLTGADGLFAAIAAASGNTYHPDSTTLNGGTFGGYLFDENGYEPEQLIEKGLFGAALVNKAAGLISGSSVSQQQIDQAVYIFGASPSFVNSGTTSKYGLSADKYLSNYTSRRDKNDGKGLYSQMKTNFIKLQVAVKAGGAYNQDKNNATAAINVGLGKGKCRYCN